jgi:hypothetical protein
MLSDLRLALRYLAVCTVFAGTTTQMYAQAGKATDNCNYNDGRGWVKCGDYPAGTKGQPGDTSSGGGNAGPTHTTNSAGGLSSSDADFIKRGLTPPGPVQPAAGQPPVNTPDNGSRALMDLNAANRLTQLQHLQSEDRDLTKKIDTTIKAIQRMNVNFDRSEEDFQHWIQFSEDRQKELLAAAEKEATSMITAKVQAKMLESFKRLDQEKADRIIAWLKQDAKQHQVFEPKEIIMAIRRLSGVESKGRMVYDAKYVTKGIGRIVDGMDVKRLQDGLPLLLDCVCDLITEGPLKKQCEGFRIVSKITVAALYNNAAQRLAVHEVERLNDLTEEDLKTLDNYSRVLQDLIPRRNKIRDQIRALKQS